MGFVIDVELQKEVQQLFSFEIWIFTTHQNTTLRQIHPFCTKKISKCPVSPHPSPFPGVQKHSHLVHHSLCLFCICSKAWKSPTTQTVFVPSAGIAPRDFIMVYRAVRDARASSSELYKNSCITHAWRTCHARLTRTTGLGASFAGFRSVCRWACLRKVWYRPRPSKLVGFLYS